MTKDTTDINERSLQHTRELLEQKVTQLDSNKIEREQENEIRRKRREEFHRRLVERSQKKRAIYRSIEESGAAIAKLLNN